MNAGDYVYFDGVNRIWVEPCRGGMPIISNSRILVGRIAELAEDEAEIIVQLRPGFELSGERMMMADILDEVLGPLEHDPDITITVTQPTLAAVDLDRYGWSLVHD